jgi:muramidase (phage lysozyme)
MASPREINILRRARSSPFGQNILRSIRYAEGTNLGKDPYRILFGGGTFNDLSRHPDTVVSKGRYSSAAAGAYQFLPPTWNMVASGLNLKDFGPEAQDLGALKLVRDRLLPIGGLATLEKEGLSPRVAARLAPEWASFPTEKGVSFYGQPVKKLADIQKVYGQQAVTPVDTTSTQQPQATQATQATTRDNSSNLTKMMMLGNLFKPRQNPATLLTSRFFQPLAGNFMPMLMPQLFQ